MARAMTEASGAQLPGAVREHNAGVMSFGNQVRARHYASFHHALETVTAQQPWSLEPARPKAQVEAGCQLPVGDFPAPPAHQRPV